MDKKITTLLNDYKNGGIARREFLRKLAVYAGSTAAGITLVPTLDVYSDNGEFKQEKDPDLVTEFIKYKGEGGEVKAYLARPRLPKKYPAVIVIHENRGLQPHILDVNRRMAREGFLSLAPDGLSPLGGTPENDPDKAVTMIRELNNDQTTKNFVAAVRYLETHPLSNGKVGCTGFCWGGGMTNQVAVYAPTLKAAVPYYGRQPADEDVSKIKSPLMAHYAENDERINQGIQAFEKALKKANIEYYIFIYPGTQHGFNNDTNPERYNEQAAKLAWKRTVDFFKKKLNL